MTSMTITTAKGSLISISGDHNMGQMQATLPNGKIINVWLGDHPTIGPVLASQSAGVQFASCIIPITSQLAAEFKALADQVYKSSLADPNTYVGAHHAYDANYSRVIKSMEG